MATPTRHFPTPPSNLALFRTIAAQLSPRQRDALAELAAGRPLTVAASAAGVHRSTLHHWLTHDPDFQSAHAALARHRAASASGLAALARAALEALLTDPALAPELRLRAIQLALTAVHTLPAPVAMNAPLEAPADLPSSAGLFRPSLEQPLVNQHLMGDDSASEPALAGPLLTTAHRSPAPTPAAQAPSAPGPSPDPLSIPDGRPLLPPTDPAERAAFLAAVRSDLRRVALSLRGAHPDHAPSAGPAGLPDAPAPGPLPATPRNAPCPCGSGRKFKRCCGLHAPPVLHSAA